MLNIAVCDDESIEIEYLTSLTNQWATMTETAVKISDFSSAEAFLFKYEEDKSFDIILLDIQMNAMDGFELAQKIRESNNDVQIVFITGFTDYMARGYDVAALNYLLKPVKKEKFFDVMSKAKERLNKVEKFVLFWVDNESIRINLNDIIYIEAFGHSSSVVCKNSEYNVKMPISDIEKMLDKSFVHCHRSYIANIRHISKITKTDVVFDNGKTIPVSRRMYNEVNGGFIRYYKGGC